ncbi:MAG: DUF3015 family protein [Deferrisomatales bacterium]|nr:DUF3015 family protein [Deferrisomatales bacterium]HSH69462.1 DUF3015 family protein [Deferrisomatales bacterium]
MKKVLVVLLACALLAPAAFAGNGKDNTGCGLGTMLFKDSLDDSIIIQSLAVTTNGTSGNQTFGITSGTSECQKPMNIAATERVNEFVVANLDGLARDIAAGGGETVSSLAELMEVPPAQRAEYYRSLQAHFGEIFPRADVSSAHVVDTVVSLTFPG